MTKIVWDRVGERLYENGVSQGVLYKADSYGVPWNGLVSVDQDAVHTSDPVYFDGFKFADLVTLGDFEGTLRAFTYPDEFLDYEGIVQSQTGFYVTDQPQTRFGLSYRTEENNDVGPAGYKIHLLYNLLALPAQRSHQTLSLDVVPMEFEWKISAIPEELDRFRPTSHVIIDSRMIDPFLLQDLEDMLYGDEETDPKLPDLNGLVSFVMKWGRLVITDLGNGLWEAYSPLDDVITMIDETTFQIVSDTAIYLDPDTYEISSTEKNTEDIWPP
jgi:hypothetical protein